MDLIMEEIDVARLKLGDGTELWSSRFELTSRVRLVMDEKRCHAKCLRTYPSLKN